MRVLPDGLRTRLAALGLDRAWPLVLVAALAVAALALTLAPQALDQPTSREIQDVELPPSALSGQLAVQDSDRDGLADALENYVYGTDPEQWDSSGTGIPDGYYAHYGYHPLDPGVDQRRTAEPPTSALPDGYAGVWPPRYQLTVAAYYELTRPADYVPGEDEPWWTAPDVPSPAQWDKDGDGIADAWFVIARLDPYATPLDQVAPGSDDTLTVRENWELGTNPSLRDTDGDGIDDDREPDIGTSPVLFSTLKAQVADGWLLALGLDPLDPGVLFVDPDRDGLTTAEEFRVSWELMGDASIQDIVDGGLDPFAWDTSGDGIPDGWLVVNGLDPLDPSVGDRVTERASDYGAIRFLDDAPDDQEPLGDLQLTVRKEYQAARPASWNESVDGVWWGGTSPATNDTDDDGLPDAIEVRGWYVQLTLDRGPGAQATWQLVTSDPSRKDSDGDGLTDLDEYRGVTRCMAPNGAGSTGAGGATAQVRTSPPTHPGRTDSAFSGLTDLDKVCGFEIDGQRYDLGSPSDGGLDPTRADTDGDLLADGAEARYWHRRARTVSEPYAFDGSRFTSSLDMANAYPRHAGASATRIASALAPDGDWDGDGLPNLLDPDSASALELGSGAACGSADADPATVFLLDGPQIDPTLYKFTELAAREPRPATDPANPDTDGDGLPDAWEVRNGRFVEQQGRWSLDPSKRVSAGAGSPDGQVNLDGDVIDYFAPPNQVRTYAHDNAQECKSDTDPNERFSDDDGVSDGWKVFWGLRYVNLVATNDPLAGQLTPAQRDSVLQRAGSVSIAPGEPLVGVPPWMAPNFPVPYTRFVPVAEGDGVCETQATAIRGVLEDVELAAWEHLPPRVADEAPCVLTADDVTRLLLPVRGAFNATYAALYGTGANPYLDDADADGVDDWFEVLIGKMPGRQGQTVPSPLIPDGGDDADGDGLTVVDEFEAWREAARAGRSGGGPDPTLVDSDYDGLSDADEVLAGFDPKDPFTRQRLEAQGGDADADGISDLDEIKGWTHTGSGPRFKTSAINPDSDGDGLLDGLVPSGPRVARFDALGIAHIVQGEGDDATTTYLGEGLYQADPTDPDHSGDRVPDGWQAYYNEVLGTPGPTSRAPGLFDAYQAGRPLWWNETRHGVWWWGLPPSAAPCDDLDGDGLSDTNGEDPFPARTDNTYVHGVFTTSDPEAAKTYILTGSTPEDTRVRAQAWAPGAGDPFPDREELLDGCPVNDKPSLQFQGLAVDPDPVTFGEPVRVTGTVIGPDGAPAEGVTVVVSALSPTADRALGATFSRANGTFALETRFAKDHALVVPPGRIFLGTVGAEVAWSSAIADLVVGPSTGPTPNRLVVWTYNTSSASAARADLVGPFHSRTSLAIDAPEAALRGERAMVNLTLQDALGRGLVARAVELSWDGTEPNTVRTLTTDASGRATTELPAATRVGETRLRAAFAGTDHLQAVTTTAALPVRLAAVVNVTAEPMSLTAGQALTLGGTVVSDGSPVAGVPVELLAGELITNTTTDEAGAFRLEAALPASTPPGQLAVVARFPGTDAVAGAEGKATVNVLGLTVLRAPGNLTVEQAAGGLIEGAAVDGRDRPVTTVVSLVAPGLPDMTGATEPDGSFALPVPPGLERGRYAGLLVAAETPERATAQLAMTLTIRSPGTLALEPLPGTVHRGDAIDVTGRLVDAKGRPVAGEGVTASMAGLTDQAITGDDGAFALDLPIPEEATLGPARLEIAYAGALDGTVTGTRANHTVFIKEPTRITLATRHAPLERPHLAGTLERVTGEAVAGARVLVEVLHAGPTTTGTATSAAPTDAAAAAVPMGTAQATTSATGGFNATLPGGLMDRASLVTVRVSFAGTDVLERTSSTSELNLTTPLVWDATLPVSLPLGRTVRLDGTVRDAEGPPIRDGQAVARLAGETIGTGDVRDGRFDLPLTVPRSVTPGPHELVIQLDPPGLHASTPLAGRVTVTTIATLDVAFDDGPLASGKPYRAIARATDEVGRPLADLTLVYWVGPAGAAGAADATDTSLPATVRTNATGHAVLAGLAPTVVAGQARDLELTVIASGPLLSRQAAVATSTAVEGPGQLSLVPALLVALIVSLVAAAAWLVHRRRTQLGEVRTIVEELLQELERGNEYSAAVLLAYKRLTHHLERYGFLDRPDSTAREFLHAVQRAMPLPPDELEAFVALFEQARYSQYSVGPAERAQAISRLRHLMAAIDRFPAQARSAGRTTT